MPYANTEAMQKHLEEISWVGAENAHAALLMDGAGWHKAKELKIPENITIITLPAYSPELNPVENIWQFLRQNYLSNRALNRGKISATHAALLGISGSTRLDASNQSQRGIG